jgi:hypothetical protein
MLATDEIARLAQRSTSLRSAHFPLHYLDLFVVRGQIAGQRIMGRLAERRANSSGRHDGARFRL